MIASIPDEAWVHTYVPRLEASDGEWVADLIDWRTGEKLGTWKRRYLKDWGLKADLVALGFQCQVSPWTVDDKPWKPSSMTTDGTYLKFRLHPDVKKNGDAPGRSGQVKFHAQLWQDMIGRRLKDPIQVKGKASPGLVHHEDHNEKNKNVENLVEVNK